MPAPILHTLDRHTGISTKVVRDTETGLPLIISHQRTNPIIADNQRMASMWDGHAMRGRPRQIANIPNVIWHQLMKLGITRDPKALRKWLSRPDTRWLRTDNGRPLA